MPTVRRKVRAESLSAPTRWQPVLPTHKNKDAPGLPEKLIEIVVRADPEPAKRVSVSASGGSDAVVDTDSPDVGMAAEFLKVQ